MIQSDIAILGGAIASPEVKDMDYRRRISIALGGSGVVVTPEMAARIYIDPRKQVEIAKEYDLNPTHVSLIKREKTWTDVTGPLKKILSEQEQGDDTMIQGQEKSQGFQPRARVVCDFCAKEEFFNCKYERNGGNGTWNVNHGQVLKKMRDKGWSEIKGKHRCPTCEAERKAAPNPAAQITDPLPETFVPPTVDKRPKLTLNFGDPAPKKSAPAADLPKQEEPKRELNIIPPKPVQPFVLSKQDEPTREQKREIISLLNAVYDTTNLRYQGLETDQSVADAIGGILVEWVADLREELFGPAHDETFATVFQNQVDAIRADFDRKMGDLKQSHEKATSDLMQLIADVDRIANEMIDLRKEFQSSVADIEKRIGTTRFVGGNQK